MPGLVPKLSETPGEIEWYGGALGTHNEEVYSGLLGLSHEEMERLAKQGVIDTGRYARRRLDAHLILSATP